MNRSYVALSVDYSQQIASNPDELDNEERINVNDVVSHGYVQRILAQYQSFCLQPDTLLFCVLSGLGAISCRSFIRRLDNIPILLNCGSVLIGKTGADEKFYRLYQVCRSSMRRGID